MAGRGKQAGEHQLQEVRGSSLPFPTMPLLAPALTLSGRSTAMVRGEVTSRSRRMWCSSLCMGMMFSLRVMPISRQKVLIATGVMPRRRMPAGRGEVKRGTGVMPRCRMPAVWGREGGVRRVGWGRG